MKRPALARRRPLSSAAAARPLSPAAPGGRTRRSGGVQSDKLDGPKAPPKQLAKKYAPITMLREQENPPCETSAEQYQPTSVETMLGNPT